jgi:hypothetical protein
LHLQCLCNLLAPVVTNQFNRVSDKEVSWLLQPPVDPGLFRCMQVAHFGTIVWPFFPLLYRLAKG